MDALIIFGFLVALAIAAPLRGYDSRDGFTSLEHARRQAWWGGDAGRPARFEPGWRRLAPGGGRTPTSVVTDPTAARSAACAGSLALTAR